MHRILRIIGFYHFTVCTTMKQAGVMVTLVIRYIYKHRYNIRMFVYICMAMYVCA